MGLPVCISAKANFHIDFAGIVVTCTWHCVLRRLLLLKCQQTRALESESHLFLLHHLRSTMRVWKKSKGVLGIQAVTRGRGGGEVHGALKKNFQVVIFRAFWCTLRQDWVILSKLNDCWHFWHCLNIILGPILLPVWVYWSICSQNWLKWLRVQTERYFIATWHMKLVNSDDFNTL